MTTTQTLFEFASNAYGNPPTVNGLPAGTVIVAKTPLNKETGFQGVAYRTPAGELVVAFKGSDSAADWSGTNLQMGPLGGVPASFKAAEAFVEEAHLAYTNAYGPPTATIFTGHSKGGAEAQYALAKYATNSDYGNVQAVTYGAPGISQVLARDDDFAWTPELAAAVSQRGLNVVLNRDLVGDTTTRLLLGEHVGRVAYVDAIPLPTTPTDITVGALQLASILGGPFVFGGTILAKALVYDGYKIHSTDSYRATLADLNTEVGSLQFGNGFSVGSLAAVGGVTQLGTITRTLPDADGNQVSYTITPQAGGFASKIELSKQYADGSSETVSGEFSAGNGDVGEQESHRIVRSPSGDITLEELRTSSGSGINIQKIEYIAADGKDVVAFWTNETAATPGSNAALGSITITTFEAGGTVESFSIASGVGIPALSADGKLTTTLSNGSIVVDPAAGTMDANIAGSHYVISGSATPSVSVGSTGATTITLGTTGTVVFDSDGNSQLVIGSSSLNLPAGAQVELASDGSLSIISSIGTEASITGPGGTAVSLPSSGSFTLLPDGQGGILVEIEDGSTIAVTENGSLWLGLPGSPLVVVPEGATGSASDLFAAQFPELPSDVLSITNTTGVGIEVVSVPASSDFSDTLDWLAERSGSDTSAQQVTNGLIALNPALSPLADANLTALQLGSQEEVFADIDRAIKGGLVVSAPEMAAAWQNIAEYLGIENDPSGQTAGSKLQGFVSTNGAVFSTIASLKSAIERPTMRSVAASTHQLISLGVKLDDGIKSSVAFALDQTKTVRTVDDIEEIVPDFEALNGLLAGAGAALSVVAAIDNPTPSTVAQAANAVIQLRSATGVVPAASAIASAIGFIENPSFQGALNTALWTAASIPGPQQPFFVAAAVVVSVVETVVGVFGGKPIVLDLDGNGVNLVAVDASTAFYDLDGDGWREHRAWVGAGDGLLAFDANGDGFITGRGELSFLGYREGARTDLEGLVAFDSNNDGKLSSADAEWGRFKVWQDADGDGFSDEGELVTLATAGITEIVLASDGVEREVSGNTVFGEGQFRRADGTYGTFADAELVTDSRIARSEAGAARPLVFNLVGNAAHTIAIASVNVSFNMDSAGGTERTAWIAPDQGFLVADADRDGTVDDASEMIGGFDQLATLDANHDGKIDAADTAFSLLRLWVDKNVDGQSQSNELYTLAQLGIASINVASQDVSRYDNGNLITGDGTFTFTDGRQGRIGEVDLLYGTIAAHNSIFAEANMTTVELSNGQTITYVGGDTTVDVGDSGIDIVMAQGGGNVISAAGTQAVMMISDDGADTLRGSRGSDTLVGGGGNDTLDYSVSRSAVSINLATNAASGGDATGDVLSGFENVIGSAHADALTGTTDDNRLEGGAGNDRLSGGLGADTFDGGTGIDIADYSASASAVNVNLSTGVANGGDAVGDVLIDMEGVAGSALGDTLIGSTGANRIEGGAGDDLLVGGAGADTLEGGTGIDTISYALSAAGVSVDLATGTGAGGDAQGDLLSGIEHLVGSVHADTFSGTAGSDILEAGEGDDILSGRNGNDIYKFGRGDGKDTITDDYRTTETFTTQSTSYFQDTYTYYEQVQTGVHAESGEVFFQSVARTGYRLGTSSTTSSQVLEVRQDAGLDELNFGPDISANDLVFTMSGNDLIVGVRGVSETAMTIAGLDDVVTLKDWRISENRVEAIKFSDGSSLNVSQIVARIGTDASEAVAFADAAVSINTGAGDDSIATGMYADTLVGGSGNDTLAGGGGDDVYRFNRGDGVDTLRDDHRVTETYTTQTPFNYQETYTYQSWEAVGPSHPESGESNYGYVTRLGVRTATAYLNQSQTREIQADGGADILDFGSGIAANDLMIGVSGNDLIVGVRDPNNPNASFAQLTDKITLKDWLISTNRIETFRFTDGSTLAVAGIVGRIGTDSADTFTWTETAAAIDGGAGNDTLTGGSYADSLSGGSGNDALIGGDGNDTLDGSGGNDTLTGGAGADTYIFGIGSGQPSINAYHTDGAVDLVRLGAGISASDVTFQRQGNDMLLTLANSSDQLRVTNWFLGAAYQIGTFELANGTPLTVQFSIVGTSGADTLAGTAGGDVFVGGAGGDLVQGGLGNDVYRFSRGDGTDTVFDDHRYQEDYQYQTQQYGVIGLSSEGVEQYGYYTVTATGTRTVQNDAGVDTLEFGSGIAAGDLAIGVSGNDLIVGVKDPANPNATFAQLTDKIVLKDWLVSMNRIETFRFADGSTLTAAGIVGRVGTDGADTFTWMETAAAIDGGAGNDSLTGGNHVDTLAGGDGNDTLRGGSGSDTLIGGTGVDTLYGDAGDDRIDGGAGNDSLEGGVGADIYVFGIGSGSDTINAYHSDSAVDRVAFGSGIAATDITFAKSGNDLVVTLAVSSDQLTIKDWFSGASYQVGSFELSSGTVVPVVVSVLGTTGSDSLTGTAGAERIVGLAGADTLTAVAGNDTMVGGAGNDTLYGGLGNDVYTFSRTDGADIVYDDARHTESYSYQQYGVVGYDGEGQPIYGYTTAYGTQTVQDNAGADTLQFGSGISATDLIYTFTGADLNVGIRDAGNTATTMAQVAEKVTLKDWTNALNRIETIRFADNISIDIGAMSWQTGNTGAETLTGGTGNDWLLGEAGADTLAGGNGNDVLNGGTGNDTLNGGAGSDTYLMDRGFGSDLIRAAASDHASTEDRLVFGGSVARNQLWFTRTGNDLSVSIIGTTDGATVENWFTDTTGQLDRFVSGDGYALLNSQVQQLVDAMAGLTPPPQGQTTLSAAQIAALDPVIAANWQAN